MRRLYFYWVRPTEEQRKEAERLGALLRDARACREFGKPCDEAYGDVPEPYLAFKVDILEAEKPKAVKPTVKKAAKKKTTRKKKAK